MPKTFNISRPRPTESGFTVVELLIATSVFSTVLLLGLTGFVQVGRSYYKGITITQTQQAAKQIMNEVSNNIRLSSSVSPLNTASAGRNYYCIGSHRYSFKLFNMVDSSNHDNSTKFGLLADQLTGNTACGNAFDAPVTALNNPTELLGNQMRLLSFSITPLSGSTTLYNVSIKVAYGQDSALTSASSPAAQCKLQLGGNQFCAITSLTTVVYQGI